MINRGPISGSGSVGVVGAGLTGRAVVPLRAVLDRRGVLGLGVGAAAGSLAGVLDSSVGLVSSVRFAVSSAAGVDVGFGVGVVALRPAGRRVRALAGGVVVVVLLELGLGLGDSGVASGVGSGVGAAATSGAGSSIRAPTDVTLFPLLAVAGVSVVGVSPSAMSGPPMTGSNEPLKRI